MEYGSSNMRDLPETEQGLSAELRDLLRSSQPSVEIMSWDRVVALVESAPPVRVPWYLAFLDSYQRQLRYAAAPMLVLLMVGGMWMMPAQSVNVGTTLVADLPSDWGHDSPQFTELKAASLSKFEDMAIPQSGMKLFLIGAAEGQQLVIVMRGVDGDAAQAYYDGLSGDFPVLAAVHHDAHPIEARIHDNMLREVGSRLGGAQKIDEMDDNQLSLLVFEVLEEAGLSNIRLDIKRNEDGRVRIDVQADPEGMGSTSELSLLELRELGYNAGNLGPDADNTLIDEIGVDLP